MRTTVTLDRDVEELLRQATNASRVSFKEALNDGLRRGLAHLVPTGSIAPFVVESRPMGLRVGLDPTKLHDIAGDLDAEAFVATTNLLRKTLGK
ncbi:MAG: hypothetical protein WD941_06140 [Opitutus sp.]